MLTNVRGKFVKQRVLAMPLAHVSLKVVFARTHLRLKASPATTLTPPQVEFQIFFLTPLPFIATLFGACHLLHQLPWVATLLILSSALLSSARLSSACVSMSFVVRAGEQTDALFQLFGWPLSHLGDDKCNGAGVCKGRDLCSGKNIKCVAKSQCHTAGVCQSGTGLCSQIPKPTGTKCNDQNKNTSVYLMIGA